MASCSDSECRADDGLIDLRVGSDVADDQPMTYIVQRQDRFYVVAYDGIDPLTGREARN